MGQENYGYCIKYGFQNNLSEISHTIEKLIKVDEMVEFEYEHHIEIIMELVQKFYYARALIKDEYSLINQRGGRAGI